MNASISTHVERVYLHSSGLPRQVLLAPLPLLCPPPNLGRPRAPARHNCRSKSVALLPHLSWALQGQLPQEPGKLREERSQEEELAELESR